MLHLPVYLPVGWFLSLPLDWFCQRSLGLLRSRQAIHRCVKHHPTVTDGWWMMGCGWCSAGILRSATWMDAVGLWGWRKTKLQYYQWWGRKLKIHGLACWSLGLDLAALTFYLGNISTVKSRENFSDPKKFCSPETSWKIFIIDGWDMI